MLRHLRADDIARESSWRESLGGDRGGARLVVPTDSDAIEDFAIYNVVRFVDGTGANQRVWEYRIAALDDAVDGATVTATCSPIIHDLGRGLIGMEIGGRIVYDLAYSLLTPAEVVDAFVLPTLRESGLSWVSVGTVQPTARRSLSWSRKTPLWLLGQLSEQYSVEVYLERSGTTKYTLNLTTLTPSSSQPIAWVGHNVLALDRTIQVDEQFATRIYPVGATLSGDLAPTGMSDNVWRIDAETSTTKTLSDPEGIGDPFAITNEIAPADGRVVLAPHAIPSESVPNGSGKTLLDMVYHRASRTMFYIAAISGTTTYLRYYRLTDGASGRIAGVGKTVALTYDSINDFVWVADQTTSVLREIDPYTRTATGTTISVLSGVPANVRFVLSTSELAVSHTTGTNIDFYNPLSLARTHAVTASAAATNAEILDASLGGYVVYWNFATSRVGRISVSAYTDASVVTNAPIVRGAITADGVSAYLISANPSGYTYTPSTNTLSAPTALPSIGLLTHATSPAIPITRTIVPMYRGADVLVGGSTNAKLYELNPGGWSSLVASYDITGTYVLSVIYNTTENVVYVYDDFLGVLQPYIASSEGRLITTEVAFDATGCSGQTLTHDAYATALPSMVGELLEVRRSSYRYNGNDPIVSHGVIAGGRLNTSEKNIENNVTNAGEVWFGNSSAFLHPNGSSYALPANSIAVTPFEVGQPTGRVAYLMFVGSDGTRFASIPFGSNVTGDRYRQIVPVQYRNGQWYYSDNVSFPFAHTFTPNANDCLIGRITSDVALGIGSLDRFCYTADEYGVSLVEASSLIDPDAVAAYGYVDSVVDSSPAVGRRNYARQSLNGEWSDASYSADNFPRWASLIATSNLDVYLNAGADFRHKYDEAILRSGYACTKTSHSLNADGSYQITVSGLPINTPINPGCWFALSSAGFAGPYATVVRRATTDGSGVVTVTAMATGTVVNGTSIRLYSPGQDVMLNGHDPLLLSAPSMDVKHAFPFILPRATHTSSMWVFVKFFAYRINGFKFSDCALTIYRPGNAETISVSGGDATSYSDFSIGGPYTLAVQVTLPTDDSRFGIAHLSLPTTCVALMTSIQAVVMPEVPPEGWDDIEYSNANLIWHSANAALLAHATPTVNYRLRVIEADPSKPFALGSTVLLVDPARGIRTDSPRVVEVTRYVEREDTLRQPEIQVDNRANSFAEAFVDSVDNASASVGASSTVAGLSSNASAVGSGVSGASQIVELGNSGSTKTIDWSFGKIQRVTLTANCTFTFQNAQVGESYALLLVQDGTGGRAVTLTDWDFGDNPATYNTTAGKQNLVVGLFNGTEYLAVHSVKGA